MSALVLDTHVLIWYLNDPSRISPPALTAIKAAIAAGEDLHIPAICFAEILYLEEKGRIPASVFSVLLAELQRPDSAFREAPFTSDIAQEMRRVPRGSVPELPDRMIAATALHLNLPLVTADSEIRSANMATIW